VACTTRVETFGDNAGNGNNDVHWIKVHVDARTRDVFSYEPQTVPGIGAFLESLIAPNIVAAAAETAMLPLIGRIAAKRSA